MKIANVPAAVCVLLFCLAWQRTVACNSNHLDQAGHDSGIHLEPDGTPVPWRMIFLSVESDNKYDRPMSGTKLSHVATHVGGRHCGIRLDNKYIECWYPSGNWDAARYGELVTHINVKAIDLTSPYYWVICYLTEDMLVTCTGLRDHKDIRRDASHFIPPADIANIRFKSLFRDGRNSGTNANVCGFTLDDSRIVCWGMHGTLWSPEGVAFSQASGGCYGNKCLMCGVRTSDSKVQCWGEEQTQTGKSHNLMNPPDKQFKLIRIQRSGTYYYTDRACGITLDETLVCWHTYPDAAYFERMYKLDMSVFDGYQFDDVRHDNLGTCAIIKGVGNGVVCAKQPYTWGNMPSTGLHYQNGERQVSAWNGACADGSWSRTTTSKDWQMKVVGESVIRCKVSTLHTQTTHSDGRITNSTDYTHACASNVPANRREWVDLEDPGSDVTSSLQNPTTFHDSTQDGSWTATADDVKFSFVSNGLSRKYVFPFECSECT